MIQKYSFDYEKYAALTELADADRELAEAAREACEGAWAPYSKFRVGAAARLRSGRTLTGSNQESEVFPATMCAERTLLFHWQAHFAGTGADGVAGADGALGADGVAGALDPIEAIAIASVPGARECYPCGQCRQVLLDCERRQGSPIRVVMCSESSASAVDSAADLLPFQFAL